MAKEPFPKFIPGLATMVGLPGCRERFATGDPSILYTCWEATLDVPIIVLKQVILADNAGKDTFWTCVKWEEREDDDVEWRPFEMGR